MVYRSSIYVAVGCMKKRELIQGRKKMHSLLYPKTDKVGDEDRAEDTSMIESK